jgi:hypothetical protein
VRKASDIAAFIALEAKDFSRGLPDAKAMASGEMTAQEHERLYEAMLRLKQFLGGTGEPVHVSLRCCRCRALPRTGVAELCRLADAAVTKRRPEFLV